MSMSTWAVGIKPPDDKWKEMKVVWDACEKAGVEKPVEVDSYFNDEPPDEAGVIVEVDTTEWDDGEMSSGLEVHLDKIDKDIKIIRFVNSW